MLVFWKQLKHQQPNQLREISGGNDEAGFRDKLLNSVRQKDHKERFDAMFRFFGQRLMRWVLAGTTVTGVPCTMAWQAPPAQTSGVPGAKWSSQGPAETTEDYNQRLQILNGIKSNRASIGNAQGYAQEYAQDYRIGREDLLEITVFEAAEFNSAARVSASGDISIPMLGVVHAAGLTSPEVELVLAELLRRSYLNDPHVNVFVKEMQSHPVSVSGAVKKAGVFQIRGPRSLLEMLTMAEGLSGDAGDTVLVMHQGRRTNAAANKKDAREEPPSGPTAARSEHTEAAGGVEEISLKGLLESADPRYNVMVYPGDSVKVIRAGIIYVVGEVKKPGGFELKNNETITILQALALAEGLTRTSAKGQARIIRSDQETGARSEIGVNLGKVMAGKNVDLPLQPRDIVIVPNSGGRSALYRGLEAAVSVGTGLAVYRR